VALACLDLEELVAERMIAASRIIVALGVLRMALTLLLLSLARVLCPSLSPLSEFTPSSEPIPPPTTPHNAYLADNVLDLDSGQLDCPCRHGRGK
jgi:hypothetical protein